MTYADRLRAFVCVAIVLASCTSISTVNVTESSPIPPDGGLLAPEHGCQPPCFWGIVPGITTEAGANKALASRLSLSTCESYDNEAQGGTRGMVCASDLQILFGYGTNIVYLIGINPTGSLTVGNVVQIYGEPDAVLVNSDSLPEEQPQTVMSLYFDSIDTTLFLPVQAGSSYHLEANTLVANIRYIEKATYELLRQKYTEPWLGYGDY